MSRKLIINREDYLKYFNKEEDKENIRQREALKYALEIRKFEIDLYWKRATYFWAFIAASFTGYYAMLKAPTQMGFLLVSMLGFIFSYSWHFVNRGSKFWQNNWERHVDFLEDEVIGPLYKTVISSEKMSFFNPTSEYPFSASKINQILSLMISLVWVILMFDSFKKSFIGISNVTALLLEGLFVGIITLIFYKFGASKLSHIDNSNEEEPIFTVRDIK